MNKKHTFKKTVAMLMGIAMAVGATGCGFITTDSQADLEQVVAKVDITGQLGNSDYAEYKQEVESVTQYLSKEITKRELVSYFLSTGNTYVENYGYSYEDTFNMLLDGLVSREILIQYAVAYYLKNNSALTAADCKAYIEAEIAKATGKESELLSNNKDVLALKYFITENNKDMTEYDKTVYSLKKSLNDSLDSIETSNYISAESEEHNHEEARTTPTNVGTAKEDYYTTDYNVYTGRNAADACGKYEKVEGSTVTSRQKAYNAFLTNLQSYNLINTDAKKGEVEDTADITLLNYYYVELGSLLGQNLINKYFESLESEISGKLTKEYMENKYEAMRALDEEAYKNDATGFATKLDSVAADSFLLYGLQDFGFVYNILLPFSTSQNVQYTEAKNLGVSDVEVFKARRNILTNVQGKDLRTSWISEHDHANYSNVLNDDYQEGDAVYFFQDQLAESEKYETLTHYAGTYAFNGTVTKDEDGEYEIKATPVGIDAFIELFEKHIDDTVGATVADGAYTTYYNSEDEENGGLPFKNEKNEINYQKFTYYTGKVELNDVSAENFFNKESDQYKALSAVNELMFAYSTDTGCLNKAYGYSVSPYTTNYVKEFEYAAWEVVKAGVGNYAVCATDYGWHILYCSFKYEDGNVYANGYTHDDREKEGTFSNYFYESIKSSAYSSYATEKQNAVLLEYDNDSCVTRYQKAYQDLLDIEA